MKALALSLVAASALLAAQADAAQRYAAPSGAGAEPCAQAAPCSLKQAITKSNTGDEVIVLAGTYTVGQNLYPPEGKSKIYVHGDFAGPMPVISSALSGGVISIFGVENRLAYLDVSNTGTSFGSAVACSFGGEVDRVRATAVGEAARGIEVPGGCVIRDSVGVGVGTAAAGLFAHGIVGGQVVSLRNVTAVASGAESTGILTEFGSAGTYSIDAVNTIAGGGLTDVVAGEGPTGASRIVMSYSNFDTAAVGPEKRAEVVEGAGVQKTPPLFVNAAGGDFREAAGSATIDAGSNDQLGPFDLAGSARIVGAAPDIGAYEFVPPAPGQIQSLSIKPKSFKAKGKKAGATVSYTLSAAGPVVFTVLRKVKRRHKKAKFVAVKGSLEQAGATGANSFKFKGKLAGKRLKPGPYKLVGSAGGATKSASFRIVK